MAAPTPTTRVAPTGRRLLDGYQSLVTIALDTNIELWEVSSKAPGLDGGDAINTTTMHNVDWRTMAARALVTLTESTIKCAYDPAVITSLLLVLNAYTTITYTYPDGSTLAFYGFVRLFEPDELVEGTMPLASVTITPTNYDYVNGVEAAPVLTSVAGT